MSFNALLPSAKIAVFTQDNQTKDVMASLGGDWRFARVAFDIQIGDVETATAHYESERSPDLLIIQTKDIGEGFLAQLEKLAERCQQGTDCVVIGPVNDVPLYRQLTQMGISDYMVAPIEHDDILSTIASALLVKHGQQDSQLITVLGTKGGVGATSMAQLTAEGLSQCADQKTLLLDAAGAWSTLPVWMGYEPSVSLKELAMAAQKKDEDTLERIIVSVKENLSIASTGAQKLMDSELTAEEFEAILNYVMPRFPYVVVDVSSASADIRKLAIQRAEKTLIVTEPNIGGLRVAKSLIGELKDLHGGTGGNVIINKTGANKEAEISSDDIKAALDQEPLWSMAWEPKLMSQRDLQDKRFCDLDEGKLLAESLCHALYPSLLSEPEQKQGLLAKLGF